jgi:hypothetical protein
MPKVARRHLGAQEQESDKAADLFTAALLSL